MNWYLKVMRQYADFKGRARRQEYWMFIAINFVFGIVAMGLDSMFGFTGGMLYVLYILITLVPNIAVNVRRLHDVGKSGWYLLIALIPLVNLWLIVLLATDSVVGSNEWGNNPKGIGNHDAINQIGIEE